METGLAMAKTLEDLHRQIGPLHTKLQRAKLAG